MEAYATVFCFHTLRFHSSLVLGSLMRWVDEVVSEAEAIMASSVVSWDKKKHSRSWAGSAFVCAQKEQVGCR